MGAQLVKEVAAKTSDIAGDGTTTAIVLQKRSITRVKNVVSRGQSDESKRGIDKAVDTIVKALTASLLLSRHLKKCKQIATISANNDAEIGTIIAEAMEKVGKDGIITVAEAKASKLFDVCRRDAVRQRISFSLLYHKSREHERRIVKCGYFDYRQKISTAKDTRSHLRKSHGHGATPLLIIADDIDGEALATLVVNKLKAGLPVCAVKAPGFGDRRKAMLEDIAIFTGATVITEELGPHSWKKRGKVLRKC